MQQEYRDPRLDSVDYDPDRTYRFVSKYGGYSIQAREHREMVLATGDRQVIQRGLVLGFWPEGLTTRELEIALGNWRFGGTYQERDEATAVTPTYRLSLFDTREAQQRGRWTEEEHEHVVRFLLSSDNLGNDFILIDPEKLEKPWASYDEIDSADSIANLAFAIGCDIEKVIAYEEENLNRPDVLEALRGGSQADKEEPSEDDEAPARPARKKVVVQ